MDMIQRDCHIAERVKHLLRQLGGQTAVEISHPIPFVVSTVYRNRNRAARFQELHQRLKCFCGIRSVLQYPYAINVIKAHWSKRQVEEVGLGHPKILSISKIP